MSTTKKTTTQNTTAAQYAPGAMGGYQSSLNTAQGLVNNPYSNPFYQQNLAQGTNVANAMNQTMQSNTNANISNSGMGVNSPAAQMLRTMTGYMGSHNQGNAFLNASSGAQNMFGMGMGILNHPLQTGQSSHGTQTESTGGLGTWLPAVAGVGLGALTGGLSGGLTGALKGAMGGLGGGGNAMGGSTGSSLSAPYSLQGPMQPSYMPGGGYGQPPNIPGYNF